MNTGGGTFGRVIPLLLPKGFVNLGGVDLRAVGEVDFGLDGSKSKEKGTNLDGPKSKAGREDRGSDFTRFLALTWSSESGNVFVPLRVMLNTGNEEGFKARTLALTPISEESSTSGFRGSGCDLGLVGFSSTLNLNSKLFEGGENLKSDLGSAGGVD